MPDTAQTPPLSTGRNGIVVRPSRGEGGGGDTAPLEQNTPNRAAVASLPRLLVSVFDSDPGGVFSSSGCSTGFQEDLEDEDGNTQV